ncbi:hypothetical protein SeMB42_g07648 [Synchytrium endobioticum]|uniref:Integrase catalytic domain-containing protein n=1 Tax=Synchytrium endobioticum TaxID=286115 RepID=A0A507C1Z4_9FUNG|nr:hypothetical protein SeMB42_g07648 [Synchytrium endobioticum]
MGKLLPLPIPQQNWSAITMDLIVKLPPSKSDEDQDSPTYDSILVVVDRRSKQAHFIPTTEKISAEQMAKLIFSHIICNHGVPESIVSDRGPQFKSKLWKVLFELLGTKTLLSSAYHPQTDGQSERTNQTLEAYLRCFSSYNQTNWASLLPQAQFAYNNTFHQSIGMSPFYAVTGQNASLGKLGDTAPTSSKIDVPEATRIKNHFDFIHSYLQHHLEKAQNRYKKASDDSRREEEEYIVGDEVLISTKNVRTERPTKKLDYTWMGPYYIKRKINQVAYEVELPSSLHIHPVFHTSLLKRYIRPKEKERQLPKPPPIRLAQDEEYYEIKDIIDVRKKGRSWQYLIEWEGYGPEERTWEPRKSLNDEPMLQEWHKRNPTKPSPYVQGEKGRGNNVTL